MDLLRGDLGYLTKSNCLQRLHPRQGSFVDGPLLNSPITGRARSTGWRSGGCVLNSTRRTIWRCTPSLAATPFMLPTRSSYSLRIRSGAHLCLYVVERKLASSVSSRGIALTLGETEFSQERLAPSTGT
jgi:hypothetical protein